jgi:hypothetical protein
VLAPKFQAENTCTEIACLDTPWHFPYGNYAYWVGGHFFDYLENRKPGTIACLFRENAKNLPFFFDSAMQTCLKKTTAKLFKDFKKDFLKANSEFYCPLNDELSCHKIAQWAHENKAEIDWQKGFFELDGKQGVVIRRNVYPHLQKQTAREILTLTDDAAIILKTAYPIIRIAQEDKVVRATLFENHNNQLQERDYELNFKTNKLVPLLSTSKPQDVAPAVVIEKSSEYKGAQYLNPTYLAFLISYFGNVFTFDTFTQLTDPLKIHSVDLNFSYYDIDNHSPFGHALTYAYRFKNYRFFTGHQKSLSYSVAFDYVNYFDARFIGLSKSMFTNFFDYQISTSYRRLNSQDFISDRVVERLAVGQSISFFTNHLDSFFRSNSTSLTTYQEHSLGQKLFYGVDLSNNFQFRLLEELRGSLSFNYGKMFKHDFNAGILMGGGATSTLTGSFPYEFSSIPYGNIWGNEMMATNLNLIQPLFPLYYGYGFLPVYFEFLQLHYGVEYIKSEIIFLGDKLTRDGFAYAPYLGLKLNGTAGYQAPVVVSLNYYAPRTSTNDSAHAILFLMDYALF